MNKDILYTFRRCPYAMRARWAILVAGIDVIWREVDLKNKPKELIEISPKSTVPVLVTTQGEVIDESLEIMRWAFSKNDIDDALRNNNHREIIDIQSLIDQNDLEFKHHLDRYKYAPRYKGINQKLHKEEARAILLYWNSRLASNLSEQRNGWLIGEKPSLADYAIWPFVRQFRLADKDNFDKDYYLNELKIWLNTFVQSYYFKPLMQKANAWSPNQPTITFPQS